MSARLSNCINSPFQASLTSVGAKDVWQDHLTGHVFAPGHTTTWMPWAFKTHYWHWLQAGWVSA